MFLLMIILMMSPLRKIRCQLHPLRHYQMLSCKICLNQPRILAMFLTNLLYIFVRSLKIG
ncbi:hypothetical protein SE17_22625 [Kouleothrix aurantiaca]|uniref:Uncharacterized protein n=1 Tax=Kouleothrix aurantiaca TaxID=186479 RepID=A0A0P9FE49_9CHLR|nr:hypothetical protein SE17_22625 [Kouleothrix aurantiaca]